MSENHTDKPDQFGHTCMLKAKVMSQQVNKDGFIHNDNKSKAESLKQMFSLVFTRDGKSLSFDVGNLDQ